MPTARALRDALTNGFDVLFDAGAIFYVSSLVTDNDRVGWHSSSDAPFLLGAGPVNVAQFLSWVEHNHFSAILPDGSLLQLTYALNGNVVQRHRLNYVPCPVALDPSVLASGVPLIDAVLEALTHDYIERGLLRSPIRFDFDPDSAGPDHPSAHLTLNDPSCRIACVAPLHPYKFLEFVFKHFYPEPYSGSQAWFESVSGHTLGGPQIAESEADEIHLRWRYD